MTVLIATVTGFLAGRIGWLLLRPALAAPVLERENHRGVSVPVAGGLVLVFALAVVEAGRAIVGAAGLGVAGASPVRLGVLVTVTGFAVLGLFDDVAGSGDARGFAGHVSELLRGRLTSGGLKLIGGGAVAIFAVAPIAGHSIVRLGVGATLVALSANLGNLFDRRPGRTIKVSVVAFGLIVAVTAADPRLAGLAVVVGAALGLLLDDLHEHVMLGDTGANALGGVLGFAVVATRGPISCTAALVVVLALNLASERVSFTAVIDRVAPLRALDRLGQRR